MMDNWTKFIFPKYKDKTVNDDDCLRMIVAKEQSKLKPVEKKTIILYCKKYFEIIGMKDIVVEINLNENPIKRGFYTKIKNDYGLSSKKDIVWFKFTTDNFLGVVAASDDINFNTTNTSGKIIGNLEKIWDTSYVIIFPLKFDDINYMNKQRIESGLGNYLISKGVPILDYFSHNL